MKSLVSKRVDLRAELPGKLMGGAKSSGESLRKNAFNLWVTVSLTTKNVNNTPPRKRNPGRHTLALRPGRALERLYSNAFDTPHSVTFKASQVPATRDGGMFWNGWHWVARFGKPIAGGTQTSTGVGLPGSPEKHNNEMFGEEGDRPDFVCDRKAKVRGESKVTE